MPSQTKRILIDFSHPAHVHFFKNAARILQERGHEVRFVARNKEITFQLMDAYHMAYEGLSSIRKGYAGLLLELFEHQSKLARIARKFKPDVMLNIGGTFIVHVGKLMGIKTVAFTDTDSAALSNKITFPFATWICTPSAYLADLGNKHIRYNGYQELAYLHPNYFTPDPTVLAECGLTQEERFFIIRFVSWGASHDVGQLGVSEADKLRLVEGLLPYGKVIISSEGPLPHKLEAYKMQVSPTKMHDLLAFSSLYVGEGTTMASEAAQLGTPAVYINTRIDGYINELVNRYRLIYHFRESKPAVDAAITLASDQNLKAQHLLKHQRLLDEKVDVTAWLVDFIEEITSRPA